MDNKKIGLGNIFSILSKKNNEDNTPVKCSGCKSEWSAGLMRDKLFICPECGHYVPMTVVSRIEMIADEGSFKEIGTDMHGKDPLHFPGYSKKVKELQSKLGQEEAVVTGIIKIKGIKTAIGVMDSRFLMGSMGTVVGEKISLLAEYADRKGYPLILFCASGGARMQEGLFSLMQMAKTAAAIERFKHNGGLYISFLTNPTTGGVSASFASLGDIIFAEPDALICFAGPRVIEQTIGEKLPKGFQRSEFLLEHGMIDGIVNREEQRETIYKLLRMHSRRFVS